jgi:hypothetical protein
MINMYLSTDALRDLMQRAAAQSAKGAAGEKRRAVRILSRSQVQIVHSGNCSTANLADVSHRGLSLFSQIKMRRGDSFILRLRSETAPAQILCTVVHCHAINQDIFKIGAEFTCTLPSERAPTPVAAAIATSAYGSVPEKSPEQSMEDEVARIQHSILD